MNCCVECFSDNQIRTIIESYDQKGDCDFCGQRGVSVYTIAEIGEIEGLLDGILDTYVISPSGKLLSAALHEDWNIFAVPPTIIQRLLEQMCALQFGDNPEFFSSPVVIPECNDKDYLSEFSITRGNSWHEFSDAIKYENRFYNNIFNPDAFASFLSYLVKPYPAGTVMYRARICEDKAGFPFDEMGPPPREKRSPGRVNPEGVGILYLASNDKTALYEVRSTAYDYVTVGSFKLLRDIRVINLASINSVSPFVYMETNDLQRFAVNQLCLKEIAGDIRKPLRRNDSLLEYLPTQIVSEFIKSEGYDGVEYSSTLTNDGYNFAIFHDSLFECTDTHVYEITEIDYHRQQIR